jgi:hypothetical protein
VKNPPRKPTVVPDTRDIRPPCWTFTERSGPSLVLVISSTFSAVSCSCLMGFISLRIFTCAVLSDRGARSTHAAAGAAST